MLFFFFLFLGEILQCRENLMTVFLMFLIIYVFIICHPCTIGNTCPAEINYYYFPLIQVYFINFS